MPFLDSRRVMFEMATTNCVLDIIRFSVSINDVGLSEHTNFLKSKLAGLSPRLPDIYSIYRFFAFEVRNNGYF